MRGEQHAPCTGVHVLGEELLEIDSVILFNIVTDRLVKPYSCQAEMLVLLLAICVDI